MKEMRNFVKFLIEENVQSKLNAYQLWGFVVKRLQLAMQIFLIHPVSHILASQNLLSLCVCKSCEGDQRTDRGLRKENLIESN